MDAIVQGFISLLDKAVDVAKRERSAMPHLRDSYDLAIKMLGATRENTITGKISRPSNGATLGFSRNIGEFDDGELNRLAHEIDVYYLERM
jgi:hypothetical protein